MAKYDEIVAGLVIELPDSPGSGVVLDTTRLNKSWYKVAVLCYDGDVLICKLRIQENGEYLDYKDAVRYEGKNLLTVLKYSI